MAPDRIFPASASAVLAAALLAFLLRAEAQEDSTRVEVCRHRAADGHGSDRIDVARLGEEYRKIEGRLSKTFAKAAARIEEAKVKGHHSGLRACEARGQKTVRLSEEVPPKFRRGTFYFVRAPRGGGRPRILPSPPGEEIEVFVVDAESLEDVALLSKTLGRRVNVAAAELARAFGVACANARVEPSADGCTATVYEEAP